MTTLCEPFQILGQRAFWTTQPDACGADQSPCVTNVSCGRPGLSFNSDRTGFVTNDWVRSLLLNMLLTDARRRDTVCGYAPGSVNGHWSESFMSRGKPVGTHARYVASKTGVRDSALLLKAEVQETALKLVDYGVAFSVKTDVTYVGNGAFGVNIEITGRSGDDSRISMTVSRSENSWAWGT